MPPRRCPSVSQLSHLKRCKKCNFYIAAPLMCKGKTDPAADEMEDESDTTTPTKKRKAPKQGRGGKPIEDEIAVAMPV